MKCRVPIFCFWDRWDGWDGWDRSPVIGQMGLMGLILIMDQSLAERTSFGASSIHGRALPQLPQHLRVLRVRHLPRAQRQSITFDQSEQSINPNNQTFEQSNNPNNRTIRTIDQSDHSLHPPPGSQTTEDSETGSAGRGRRLEIFAPHIHRPHARNPCEVVFRGIASDVLPRYNVIERHGSGRPESCPFHPSSRSFPKTVWPVSPNALCVTEGLSPCGHNGTKPIKSKATNTEKNLDNKKT